MTGDADPDDPAAGLDGADLEEMAAAHTTAATEAARRRLTGLVRTNSQVHASPRPGVRVGHGQSISGRAVRRGDVIFRGMAAGSGGLVLVIMAAIAIFLVWKALPAITGPNNGNLLTTQAWNFPSDDPSDIPTWGIAALLFGTVVSALIAIVIGVPIAIGIALFIAHYAKRRLATLLGGVVDLLAAVPSLVFGMWGLYFLVPSTRGFQSWLSEYFGWLPFLHNRTATQASQFGQSLLIAGVVLAIMIIPTVSAVTREVFLQVPGETMDAAWALGATKWEMVRAAVLPFGRAGMISAAMLGLGRALGETIAVALVLNSGFTINTHITEQGGDTFASTIALKFGEAASNNLGIGALITAGLFLFGITLVVNSIARLVIARRKEFS
ncbi:phosphate ABC transporter membrane protein 1, PhoT family [Nakamurella panacisegetis]|uniref:Phosphate transport system permease protein n=1 Tax=Nakamurella panacisegetis TaxID=1090615 RepID=A0A1H0JL62_9ACTN|nr:phosphate ABC transporter permease subunit PstC [Nakamurella panacisegetis]SDO44545.1 phosphate ABC transporter membrane protein 1, PhoT family [Nakamurella panacisegetis]